MTLTIYDTAARKKVPFKPLEHDTVKMYVCGPTVYNYVHIGNARPVVVFDTLFRVLKTMYSTVIYARNITDIDDKIMAAAAEQGIAINELANHYATEFEADMAALNALPPTLTPYATDNVDAMISVVQTLVDKGHAYVADGHVLFDVQSMPDYGALSGRALEDMLAGARVEVAGYKKYPGDFVLWKPSEAHEPGWLSPWGRGRPGWHLECSAMIEKHLGDTIDIHGGGRDLVFPHHENERAQSECAHGGKTFVRHWMHNGYINLDGEKMSKSLGNFKTVRELLSLYPGEVLRFALLSANYRSELDFTKDLLAQSKYTLDTFYAVLRKVQTAEPVTREALHAAPAYRALLDDLNTPLAISELHAYAKQINKNDEHSPKAKGMLVALGELLGILQADPEQWFTQGAEVDETWIASMIAARQQAKIDKDYLKADELRAQLLDKGIILEDSRDGTKWRRDA